MELAAYLGYCTLWSADSSIHVCSFGRCVEPWIYSHGKVGTLDI
jgi:hypothetical protein